MNHETTRKHRTRRILVWAAVALALAILFTGCPQNPFFGLQPNPRDEEGPEITIINPTDGQSLSGLLVVTGVTTDKYQVDQVSVTVGARPTEVLEGTYSWYYTLDTAELGAGTYAIVVSAVDQFGNVGEKTVTVTVDQDVPSVEFPYDPTLYENHFSGTNLTLSGTADDNTSVVRVQISLNGGLTFSEANVTPSGGAWTWSYTIADTDAVKPGDGDVTAVLRVYDDAGLIGTTSQIVYFDNTSPAATIATPANDVTIDWSADLTGDSLVVSGAASDNGPFGVGSIEVELRNELGALLHSETIAATDSNGIEDYSQSFYLPDVGSGSGDIRSIGPIAINVIATDRAGNTFTETVDVSLDDDPPAFSGTIDRDGVGALNGDLSQPVNNFASGDQIIRGTVTSPEGVSDLYVEVKAGATENGDSVFAYELVDNPDDGTLADGDVDDPSGTWSYTLDPSRFPSDGDYYLTFRVTKVDKGFERVSRCIRIDRAAPTVTINTPNSGAQVAGTNVSVSGEVAGTGGDVQFIDLVITDDVNGAAAEYVNTRFSAPDFTTPSPASDGTYGAYAELDYAAGGFAWLWDTSAYTDYTTNEEIEIAITVTDMAGNTETSAVTVQKDPDAPTASFVGYQLGAYTGDLTPGRYINGSGTISGDAYATQGVDSIRVSTDGTTWGSANVAGAGPEYTWDYTLPGVSPGTATLYLEITDTAATPATNTIAITVEVDNDDPVMGPLSIDLQDGSGTDYYHGTVLISGTASDATSDVDTVGITIDGTPLPGLSGTLAYSGEWDTETLPTVTKDGVVVVAEATDLAGNTATVSPADAVNVRPYVYSVSKDEAYLGETGLIVYGNNIGANGDFGGVALSVGGGAVNPSALDATLSPNELTFDIPAADPFPSPYTGPRSGPVLVEYGGLSNADQEDVKMDLFHMEDVTDVGTPTYPGTAYHDGTTSRAVHAYAGSQGNNRFVYFANDTAAPVEVFSGDAPTDGTAMYTDIAGAPGGSERLYLVYRLEKQGVFVATSDNNYLSSTTQTIAAASASFTDIAVSNDGRVHVVYYDGGDLFYRYSDDEFATGPSAVEDVDVGASDAGQWVAIATDSFNRPHVVYQDVTNNSLMYTYRDSGGTWATPATVDSDNAGFLGNDIAVDATDGIHVSYYNGDTGDLRYAYARGATSGFSTQIVDALGVVGLFSSIAVDGSNDPHITYATFGSTPKPKYARMTPEGFVSVFIAEDGTFDINNNSNSTATIVGEDGIVSMIYTTTDPGLVRARYLPEL